MSLKLLIADDEVHNRLLIERTLEDLEDEGVVFLYACHGGAALEKIKAERPKLVFLDVMMPIMNGMDVCDQVKNKLALSDIYIILLADQGEEVDEKRGREVGADLYLTKPIDTDKLLEKARKILGI
ncbi:MAG: hypothetical protein DHS20C18_45710 [Saprospiraceae bacterium]|nr:MAG: hypothetical protein DHS20C18_45710 [Saprospiraceae bacterium]